MRFPVYGETRIAGHTLSAVILSIRMARVSLAWMPWSRLPIGPVGEIPFDGLLQADLKRGGCRKIEKLVGA